MTILGIIILIIGIILIIIAKSQKKIREAVSAGVKVSIKDIKPGIPIEIFGTVESAEPLKTPFGKRPCIYYEYELERGEESTENPSQYVWRRIAQDSASIPFYAKDDTGRVMIYPEGAGIEAPKVSEKFVGPESLADNPVTGGLISIIQNAPSRVREKALLVNSPVYVLGEAMPLEKEMVIQKGRSPFLISYKTEQEVQKELEKNITVLATLGILGLIAGIVLIVVGLL